MKKCKPSELALKAYFLGPQAENASFLEDEVSEILQNYFQWRQNKFPQDGRSITPADQRHPSFRRNKALLVNSLDELCRRFQNEIPQFSPRYMAHMYSELSLPGLLGHWTAALHNPNNISRESSHVGMEIEAEAISFLCNMLGWKKATGHFTSGGSLANLEAMLRMREKLSDDEKHQKPVLILSTAAHYSWKKSLKISGFDSANCLEIPLDSKGRMDILKLEKELKQLERSRRPIMGLVSLFGSTELGTVDDISAIGELLEDSARFIWHHVDAAYGGFFASCRHAKDSHLERQAKALCHVHSLTLDPHKLGYIPFGCGAFLCRLPELYHYAELNVPYIQFQSAQDRGLQTIEGSRPATGPSATWLLAQTIGLHSRGLGLLLQRHLKAQKKMRTALKRHISNWIDIPGQDLNILCWSLLAENRKLSESNKQVQKIYQALPASLLPYFVAKTSLNFEKHAWLRDHLQKMKVKIDVNSCDVIRMTMMNPFSLSKESETKFIDDFIRSLKNVLRA